MNVLPFLTASALVAATAIAQLDAQAGEPVVPATEAAAASARFHAPVRLKTVSGKYVRTEAPGFAAPTCFDVDGDGKKDLVVGQFNQGKLRV